MVFLITDLIPLVAIIFLWLVSSNVFCLFILYVSLPRKQKRLRSLLRQYLHHHLHLCRVPLQDCCVPIDDDLSLNYTVADV
ncbi:hypothetical protein BDB00DRAFT_812678 [Zychaea mexicana]|uniref:uncharacterized protein n=1 Tax=Zychaea mexicana TaxID=64656 RepID=UPI0022FE70DC|nr:uncharacterized protein BDB00DRAFT_812678 [Zychaea mexicana]KAI9495621.1 hypothetical protein BDB00DRAFT_812678 [Zychaea mexicana]